MTAQKSKSGSLIIEIMAIVIVLVGGGLYLSTNNRGNGSDNNRDQSISLDGNAGLPGSSNLSWVAVDNTGGSNQNGGSGTTDGSKDPNSNDPTKNLTGDPYQLLKIEPYGVVSNDTLGVIGGPMDPCPDGTTDIGIYYNAHNGNPNQPISIRLCQLSSINKKSGYDSSDPPMLQGTTKAVVQTGVANNFQKMGEAALAAGIQLRGDGMRSFEKQQYFYGCYLSGGCNNGNLAARPGTSNHEYGTAVDFDTSRGAFAWLVANARKYGICATVASETWHWAMKENRSCFFGS